MSVTLPKSRYPQVVSPNASDILHSSSAQITTVLTISLPSQIHQSINDRSSNHRTSLTPLNPNMRNQRVFQAVFRHIHINKPRGGPNHQRGFYFLPLDKLNERRECG